MLRIFAKLLAFRRFIGIRVDSAKNPEIGQLFKGYDLYYCVLTERRMNNNRIITKKRIPAIEEKPSSLQSMILQAIICNGPDQIILK